MRQQPDLTVTQPLSLSLQPPVPGLRHRGQPRHAEGVGRAGRERDVPVRDQRLPASGGHPLHPQHRHCAVRDRLLHQQVRIRHRVLQ